MPLEHFLQTPEGRAAADRWRDMTTFTLERTQIVSAPVERAWAFYADPQNLEAITPPWLRFRIDEAPEQLLAGSLLRYRLHLFGVPIRWLTEIRVVAAAPVVRRRAAPRPVPPLGAHPSPGAVRAGTEIHDHVRYRVPGGRPVDLVVRRLLAAIFDYRARRTAELLSSTS